MQNILAHSPTVPRTTDDPEFKNFLQQQHPTTRALLVHIAGAEDGTSGVQTAMDDLTAIVPAQLVKTVAASGTPEAIAADGTFFRHATIIAKKAARTANSGIVYLGVGTTNDTQGYDLDPGDIWTIDAPVGTKLDLNDFVIDVATNADGVIVIYW